MSRRLAQSGEASLCCALIAETRYFLQVYNHYKHQSPDGRKPCMNDFAIRTEALSRSFGPLLAVDSLTLEVPAGIVFGFLGANGAGKTTTIHLLLGLLEPTGGRASV